MRSGQATDQGWRPLEESIRLALFEALGGRCALRALQQIGRLRVLDGARLKAAHERDHAAMPGQTHGFPDRHILPTGFRYKIDVSDLFA